MGRSGHQRLVEKQMRVRARAIAQPTRYAPR
jgi:hypothetical protein